MRGGEVILLWITSMSDGGTVRRSNSSIEHGARIMLPAASKTEAFYLHGITP